MSLGKVREWKVGGLEPRVQRLKMTTLWAATTRYCHNVWFQKISIPPPWKGSDFPGEGGVGQFALFSSGEEGGKVGKYFQRVLVARKRVTKKKHRNLRWQFICEDIKHDES